MLLNVRARITLGKRQTTVNLHATDVLVTESNARGLTRYGEYSMIYAMSLIGSEQAIRAIAAASSDERTYNRAELVMTPHNAPYPVITARWGHSKWDARSVSIGHGYYHTVAIPRLTGVAAIAGEESEQVSSASLVVPEKGDEGLETRTDLAIYRRLLLLYSTPLMPIDSCDPVERALARQWVRPICRAVRASVDNWQPLTTHPVITSSAWEGAGILSISESQLDKIVQTLVRNRQVPMAPTAADTLSLEGAVA